MSFTLKSRGVRFTAAIADHGYGLVTYFEAPGGIKVQLYEPRYVKGTSRGAAKRAKSSAPKRKAATKTKKKPGRARRRTSGRK